ncbi:hypothetical protein ACHAWC_008907 [Mediolabrus comicus]
MMKEEEHEVDIENPSPAVVEEKSRETSQDHPNDNAKNKWLLLAFIAVVVCIALGLGLGLGLGLQGTPASSTSNGGEKEEEGKGEVPTNNNVDTTTSTIAKSTYLDSPGPIQARIRMASANIANGYTSCNDLRDDIENALKHLANTIILEQSKYDWYASSNCRGDDVFILEDTVGSTGWGSPVAEMDMASPPASNEAALAAGGVAAKFPVEDSYGTNNQVQGVDEADVVKSDGKHVFTAYGDVLFAWDALNPTAGLSITRMPYNETSEKDCPYLKPFPEPMPVDVVAIEDEPVVEAVTAEAEASSSSGSGGRRKTSMMIPHCYTPKPQIHSLLLHGGRLTAIVSEQTNHYSPFTEDSLFWDYQELAIKVYDAEDIPLDGSPLKLLGEKKIQGNYHDARSIDSSGIVITTSHVNTNTFTSDLYRWNSNYCGMSNSEYEALAKETALNKTESFTEKMMKDLELELGGNCEDIFQVAAMQAGDSKDVYFSSSNLLDHFVRVMNFDMGMSANELATDFATASGGTFAPGWPNNIYVSQGFAGVINVGHDYNLSTNEWEESTFVSAFDITKSRPQPFAYAQAPGRPLNKFATDLYEGHLRLATTKTDWSNTDSTTVNQIFVFQVPAGEEQGPDMELVGSTGHLGKKNERITAVRFKGDRAYVVTFEQIDPFYVVNMSDPRNPKVIGELELPGFSQYLHEVEIDEKKYMLGLGREDALKIALFDISTDETKPTQTAFHLEKQASSAAGTDSLAFRYLPKSQFLIIPKSDWTFTPDGNFDGFVVYSVNRTHIAPVYEIQHADSQSIYRGCWYNAWLSPRSLVFQSKLTTMLSHSVVSTDLQTGDEMGRVNLDEKLNNTDCHSYYYWY